MAIRRDALAARREALGYTQETLAQELGVELSTIGRWERGTLTPQPWRRPDLAKVLKLSLEQLDELLTQSGPRPVFDRSRASRREVMVDAALLTTAVVAGHLVSTDEVSTPRAADAQVRAGTTISGASILVARAHRAYQAAHYGETARLLPPVTAAVDALVAEAPAKNRREALRLQWSVAVATAKLATKAGDLPTAWTAAERAKIAAEAADDPLGLAASAYQLSCVHLREGRHEDAERLSVSSAESIRGDSPESLTWRGALTLLSAIIAARRNDPAEAARRLDHADGLAQRLGTDGNIGWTAFGPTNVAIHRVSSAIALDNPSGALETAQQIDITAMPDGLHGRQAQFHLDNAWAHVQLGEDPQAVIHLLDTERVAPELVRANPNAHALIRDLLARERRRTVPGLRGLAVRAGVAA